MSEKYQQEGAGSDGEAEESWASSSVRLELEFMNNRFICRSEVSQGG